MISKEFISHHITESIKSKLKRQVIHSINWWLGSDVFRLLECNSSNY